MITSAKPPQDSLRGTASVALLCQFAGEYGITLTKCLHGTGIVTDALTDPEAEITADQELRLIANILDEVDDPEGLGLEAGVRYRLATYGIWGFAVLSSRTGRDAAKVAMRFIELTYACTRIAFDEQVDTHTLTFGDWDVPESVRRFVLERDVTAAVAVWAEALNRPVALQSLTARLPTPVGREKFGAILGVAPHFEADRTVATFDRAMLDLPLPQASPLTAQLCAQQCRQLLHRRHARRGVSGRIRDLVAGDPRTVLSQDRVAAALDMSVRTLRRRLADEGLTYRAVIEQTREQLAEELLTRGLTVEQVTDRLGYSEASSFAHAFTRWKGMPPRRWADTAGVAMKHRVGR